MPLSESQIKYRKKNKDIINQRKREHRLKPETKKKNSESHRKWRIANYQIQWLKRIEHRCIKHGIEFNLTLEDFDIPGMCPALDIPLIVSDSNKFQSPSMDRIDPQKGYTKGNVRVISYRANQIKSNSTIDEMEKVLQYYKGCV